MAKQVAPSLIVCDAEYDRRFGGMDLDYYRERMAPALFDAFVRHMGVITGDADLDVVAMCEQADG